MRPDEVESPPPESGHDRRPTRRERARRFVQHHRTGSWIALALLLVAIVAIFLLERWLSTFESTDDAQIDAHIARLSARIEGNVSTVKVQENEVVVAGQPLVELDPRDRQVALERALAELALAQSQLAASSPAVPITATSTRTQVATSETEIEGARAALQQAVRDRDAAEARIREAHANQDRARHDLERFQYLLKQEAASRSQYDEKLAVARATAASLDRARAETKAAAKIIEEAAARLQQAESRASEADKNAPRQLAVQRATVASREAQVKAAETQLARAQLDLEYTRVTAPADGVIGRRAAEVGEHVQPGQELLAFVDTRDQWVTANFKETQLRRMKVGQRARVHVDALERSYDGTIDSFAAASGARFSLLPPENATGNYVKVVQRIPLRVRLRAGQAELERLRPGMSVEVKVYVK